ncbi:hypothetical protein QMK19_39220 [Streptomyces sp. H10-C2]|uniref:hypothetical protein n=1 Tax=unclassified Streptomyces TaxID=2593676 RepID=UPI0024B9F4BF|nr:MULTISPECIES: hypothetical protein [unclassified Streptomyces]MDJ0347231.1 hypothetical protein [Streptomyces sp. PH10-H1]MDJ0375466.1 hypothetical protein [Streptomyces sp. H10-C2]
MLTDTRTQAAYWQREQQRRAAAAARQEAERAAERAELQPWMAEEDEEEAPNVPQCATPDCQRPVDTPVDRETDLRVPPEDDTYCGPCRLDRAWSNRGLRGALRRMRNAPGDL